MYTASAPSNPQGEPHRRQYYFSPLTRLDQRYSTVEQDLPVAVATITASTHQTCPPDGCGCATRERLLNAVFRAAYDPRARFDPSSTPGYAVARDLCAAVIGQEFTHTHLADIAGRERHYMVTLEREAMRIAGRFPRLHRDRVADAVTKTVMSRSFALPVHDEPALWPYQKPGILRSYTERRAIDELRSQSRGGVRGAPGQVTLIPLVRSEPGGGERESMPSALDDDLLYMYMLCMAAAAQVRAVPVTAPVGAKRVKANLIRNTAAATLDACASSPGAFRALFEDAALVTWPQLRRCAPETWGRYGTRPPTRDDLSAMAEEFPSEPFFTAVEARRRNLTHDLLPCIKEQAVSALLAVASQ